MNPLSDQERVDIRRFCGYPAYGATPSGTASWRFFTAYGLLEFRLTNMSMTEITVVRRYLATLANLELAIPGASDSLDTDQASVWTRNKSELTDRMMLFDNWRRRLSSFIGVPSGPALSQSQGMLIV